MASPELTDKWVAYVRGARLAGCHDGDSIRGRSAAQCSVRCERFFYVSGHNSLEIAGRFISLFIGGCRASVIYDSRWIRAQWTMENLVNLRFFI